MPYLLTVISLLLFVLEPAHATGSVYILLSKNSSSYQQAAEDIKGQLNQSAFQDSISVSTLDHFTAEQIDDQDLIVSVGEAAARYSQQAYPHNTHLYSFVDKNRLPDSPSPQWAAVLLDQPLSRLVDTARLIVEDRYPNKLVIAVSENNTRLRDDIAQLTLPDGLELEIVVVEDNTEPAKMVNKALFNAGALIAVRDPQIWSGESAKWMLYQSYKYNVPVIGYSKSFLKAGALLSVYARLEDIARSTAELIMDWHQNQGRLSREGLFYPPFTISANKHIARALSLPIPDNLNLNEQADVRN